ncbi:MAG: hypothetical protein JJU05_17975 [Verrucomicrobia bacterium]|nr:hypothetical protein [Verrucomicrobiota bacterium]
MEKRGSALLVTLLVMSLLVMLTLGLAAYVRMELRAVVQYQLMKEARANARLGVELGVARLQELMGPDARITAPSGLLDTQPETPGPEGLRHPHLTGVWDARSESLNETPDYSREAPFRQWLVSNAVEAQLHQFNFPEQGALADPVRMVAPAGGGAGAVPEAEAGRLPVRRGDEVRGKTAWWVGDENMKARINLHDGPDRAENTPLAGDLLAGYATPGAHGIRALDGFDSFDSNSEWTDRSVTRGLLDLVIPVGSGGPGHYFHHLTPYAESVLADVTRSRLRKDLSLFLERRDIDWLQAWGQNSVPDGPLGPNGEIALSPPGDHDVLPWKFLHHWYNMHRRQIQPSPHLPLAHLRQAQPEHPVNNPDWNSGVMRVKPVMVRFQLIVSYFAQRTSEPEEPGGESEWEIRFNAYPVATLWNPFNVGIEEMDFSAYFHVFPLEHSVYLNDTKLQLSGHGTRGGDWAWQDHEIMQVLWGDTINTPPVILAPGEAKQYHTTNRGHRLNMREGAGTWLPEVLPAGLNRRVATITARPSDRITIETRGRTFETTGIEYQQIQTTFSVRTAARSRHPGHQGGRVAEQMFSGLVGWRHEQVNPRSVFVSTDNFNSQTLAEIEDMATPFLRMDLRLKTLDEPALPNKTWLHNIPAYPYASGTSTGMHGAQMDNSASQGFFAHPYVLSFEQVNQIEGLLPNRPWFGPSNTAAGLTEIVGQEIPMAPLTSLAQLQHLPQYPVEGLHRNNLFFQNHAIGNSRALPALAPGEIKRRSFPFYFGQYYHWVGGDMSGRTWEDRGAYINDEIETSTGPAAIIDRSYAANHLLFDSYFFSSMAALEGPVFQHHGTPRSLRETVEDFHVNGGPLPNSVYRPRRHADPVAIVEDLLDTSGNARPDAYRKAAASMMTAGGFNINSTSVPAWTAVLASSHLRRPVIMQDGVPTPMDNARFLVSRHTMPIGPAAGNTAGDGAARWRGYRELTETDIRQLAEAMVRQVKERGPFRSLGEFVNRRLSGDRDLALRGALEAALEDPDVLINQHYRNNPITAQDVSDANYRFVEAATGSRYQGTPAYISQADILNTLAPLLNARSDTFIVRGYGEVHDPVSGAAVSKVYCEAVVQRVPDYLDPADAPETPLPALTSTLNETYGRRFHITSFRWLDPDEITQ